MAGEWIKMRSDLIDDPAVFRMSTVLGIDKFSVVGRLQVFWSWIDKHSVDGSVDGAVDAYVDEIVRLPGFARALESVKWLEISENGISIPKFQQHNGETAKDRSQKNSRQARWRANKDAGSGNVDAKASTGASTREEKRRSKQPPLPPKGDESDSEEKPKRTAIALKTYLESCKAEGSKPIPDDDAVFDYAETAGIPSEFLWLQWKEFVDRYRAPDAKRYKDWRAVFRKTVRGNWFKLWFVDSNGQYLLTTQGIQAQNTHKGKAA